MKKVVANTIPMTPASAAMTIPTTTGACNVLAVSATAEGLEVMLAAG